MRKIRFFIKFPEGNLSFFKIIDKDYGETESQKNVEITKRSGKQKIKYKRVEKYYYDISSSITYEINSCTSIHFQPKRYRLN